MRKFFEWIWATYQTMSLFQWLIALPIWGVGASAIPIIGVIKSWPIWLLAIVSAIVAFLWMTILTWVMSNFNSMKKQETKRKDNAPSNSAIANNNSMAINAPNAGQVIGKIEVGRGDVIINTLSSMAKPADERNVVGITPDELTRFFHDGQTTIQSRRAVEPFIGKWMKVEGDLGDVDSGIQDNIAHVTFVTYRFTGELGAYKHLYMRFSGKKWIDKLYTLTKGTHIVVNGQILDVNIMSVSLDNCELIE